MTHDATLPGDWLSPMRKMAKLRAHAILIAASFGLLALDGCRAIQPGTPGERNGP